MIYVQQLPVWLLCRLILHISFLRTRWSNQLPWLASLILDYCLWKFSIYHIDPDSLHAFILSIMQTKSDIREPFHISQLEHDLEQYSNFTQSGLCYFDDMHATLRLLLF